MREGGDMISDTDITGDAAILSPPSDIWAGVFGGCSFTLPGSSNPSKLNLVLKFFC